MRPRGRRRALGRLLPLALLLLAAACADPAAPRRNPVMTGEAVVVAADGSLVEARLFDLPPGAEITAILLIGPDGGETASGPFQTSYGERGPGYGPAGIGVTLSGGSNSGLSTGVSVGVNSTGGGPSQASTTLVATIAVPEPARLLEDRRAWRVEARWIEVGGVARVLPLPWR